MIKNDTPIAEVSAAGLGLLQKAVSARMAYWDALEAFETHVTLGSTFTDASNDAVIHTIGNLAAGLQKKEDVVAKITTVELAHVLRVVEAV